MLVQCAQKEIQILKTLDMKSAYRKSKERQGPANVNREYDNDVFSTVVIALILLSWDGPRKSKKVHFSLYEKDMAPLCICTFLSTYHMSLYLHTHMKVTNLISIILISHLHQPLSISNLQSNYFYPSEQKKGEREIKRGQCLFLLFKSPASIYL